MISIVIPTVNEAENVEPLVRRIMQCAPPPDEILFVDDGSTDGTGDAVRTLALKHPVRLLERDFPAGGLSGAVIAGARAARGDILVVMDADLSHPPERIADLVRPLSLGVADLVIGSRYIPGASTPGWPLWRKLMSRVAAAVAFPMTGVHDSLCGFFAMRRHAFIDATSYATGFKIAFEAIMHGGPNLRVLEIPIVFHNRARGISKMSFGVAILFFLRWIAAGFRLLSREHTQTGYKGTEALAAEIPLD